MYSSWLEETRSALQSIQVLQQAIVGEMLALQDNPKERSISEHRIKNFLQMIQERAKTITTFMKEEAQLKKEELAVIEGHKSLKPTDKKKPTDIIWQNFYDKAKELKDQYRKQDQTIIVPRNTVQYYRQNVFKPPFSQPAFTIEQTKGKHVDMHEIYNQFLNICKIMEDNKELTKLHDYLWFLQNMDKFDDFPINKKIKNNAKYTTYLTHVYEYLADFLKRSRPLQDFSQIQESIKKTFEDKYPQGKIIGWDPHAEHIDEDQAEYCSTCNKLFISNEAFVGHLMGKKHIKLSQKDVVHDAETQQKQRRQFKQKNESRKKNLAFMEYRVSRLREQLASVIYNTMNLVRKKQSIGYEQVEDDVSEQSSEEQVDAPIYNPKNLPLGWDGKPIPYWLYKLHGLGIEYKCQICGNYSYWGRRAFEMHFQEWRHTYGMKCLKIPNTIHFKDITTINDALALHEKLMRESQQSQFRPDMQEEFEDEDGNLLNKKTYLDMRKQGLIQ